MFSNIHLNVKFMTASNAIQKYPNYGAHEIYRYATKCFVCCSMSYQSLYILHV